MLSRTAVRALIVVLALAASGALAWRAVQQESAFVQSSEPLEQVQRSARAALAQAEDVRASLYAYVATAQPVGFWTGRGAMAMDALASSLPALDEAAASLGVSDGESAEALGARVKAAEARARTSAREGQPRLAADVIFNEGRTGLDALVARLNAVGDAADAALRTEQQTSRRAHLSSAGLLLGIWLVTALLLLPRPRAGAYVASSNAAPGIAREMPAGVEGVLPVATPEVLQTSAEPEGPSLPAPRGRDAGVDLDAAATVCGDLARVSEADQITGLVERTARVLNASGVIVWLSERDQLYAAAAWGYDADMLARVSSMPHDARNLTAVAFRSGSLRTSPAQPGSPAALAAPLIGPQGTVGVMSAEMQRGVSSVPEVIASMAAIFAAQLVTIVASIPQASGSDTTETAAV